MCEIKREEKRERAVKVMSEKRVKQQRESKTRKRYMWNEERGGKWKEVKVKVKKMIDKDMKEENLLLQLYCF